MKKKSNKIFWTKDKRNLIKEYLKQGYSVQEVAGKLNYTYDQINHTITRYNLRKGVETDLFLKKKPSKLKKNDVVALAKAIGEQIVERFEPFKLTIPKAKKLKGKNEEVSILDISDVHIGMINEVYNSDNGKSEITFNAEIFEQEMEKLLKSIFSIHKILSNSYNLRKLVINVMGDIVTNDRIFPEQAFEIDKCVGAQVWTAIPAFIKFFNYLLNIYDEIEVVCVIGNHSRSNPHHYNEPVENSFEYFIYRTWQKQFENNPRVNIIVPVTRRYIHEILGWKHLIEHGDQLRGYTPTAIEKQLKEIYLNVGGFDVMHFGHLHKLGEQEISDKVLVKINGSWIYRDSYGFNKFKTYSLPKQHFFGCSKKKIETWNYKIDLRI